MKHNRIYFFLFLLLMSVGSVAQKVAITQAFHIQEMTTAMGMYKNEFGHRYMPALDVPFPYYVVRVVLEGDEHAVTTAKEKLTLYLGQLTPLEGRYTGHSNEIQFLVPYTCQTVYLDCGDGCDRILLMDNGAILPRQPDRVYQGVVRYTPARMVSAPDSVRRQYFTFNLTPKDALLEVLVDGEKQLWATDNGVASESLPYGSYRYFVSAKSYQSEEGTIEVSDTRQVKNVSLQPLFGWLSVEATDTTDGASVFVTHQESGVRRSLGTVPIVQKELDKGSYTLQVLQSKYKTYTEEIVIATNEHTVIRPRMESNFVPLLLEAVQDSAQDKVSLHECNTSNLRVTREGATIVFTYDLKKDSPVRIRMATDGSSQYTVLTAVSGDVGSHVTRGKSRRIVWRPEEEPLRTSADQWHFRIEAASLMPKMSFVQGSLSYSVSDDGFSVEVDEVSEEEPYSRLNIPSSVTYKGSAYEVVSIGEGAFYDCKDLTAITLPSSVKRIGTNAFYGCDNLTAITLPNSVTSIGDGAFYGCNRLASIALPNAVTSIGASAFYGCYGLSSITLPNGVTSIGYEAFCFCNNLSSITLPSSVTHIDDGAFKYCDNLSSIVLPKGVTRIGAEMFKYCNHLTVITIPNSVTSIGDGAFYGCTNLASIAIPNGVTSIGEGAFYDCKNLTTITLPSSVNSIGNRAFVGCTNLDVIYILRGTNERFAAMDGLRGYAYKLVEK